MKAYKVGVLCLLFVFLLGWVCMTKAEAAPGSVTLRSGELCFDFTRIEPSQIGPFLMRIMFTKIANGYYSLQGIIPTQNEPLIFAGGGIVVGNELIATVSMSQDHFPANSTWRDSGIAQLRFNLSDMSASLWSIRADYDSSESDPTYQISNAYATGIGVLRSCP